MARLRASWRTSLPVVQQPRNLNPSPSPGPRITGVALPPSPTIDPPNGMPLSSQTGAPSGQGIGSATPIPTTPTLGVTNENPVSNQPAPAPPGDAAVATPIAPPPRV